MNTRYRNLIGVVACLLWVGVAPVSADQQILDDLIVVGSACIGQDCVNGESFGFDTLRLKENNLRIKAQDTSSTASFPTQDWQITFNETSNGGANKFSIDAISPQSSTPFTIEAGARNHALYVEDDGDIGIGTNTPVVDLHIKTGNTPTLRLEQDGTSGFTPQTWDVAGNEANFFIRDATNGSRLVFRVFPNAPNNALTIEASTGDIGLGTTAPEADLHIVGDGGTGATDLNMLIEDSDSRTTIAMEANSSQWQIIMDQDGDANEGISFTSASVAGRQMRIDTTGNVRAQGNFFSNGTQLMVPDYVFEPEYELMPLDELAKFVQENKHLPNVETAGDVKKNGLNVTGLSLKLLEKVEELTLYTIDQQKALEAREQETVNLKAEIEELKTLVNSLNNQ